MVNFNKFLSIPFAHINLFQSNRLLYPFRFDCGHTSRNVILSLHYIQMLCSQNVRFFNENFTPVV